MGTLHLLIPLLNILKGRRAFVGKQGSTGKKNDVSRPGDRPNCEFYRQGGPYKVLAGIDWLVRWPNVTFERPGRSPETRLLLKTLGGGRIGPPPQITAGGVWADFGCPGGKSGLRRTRQGKHLFIQLGEHTATGSGHPPTEINGSGNFIRKGGGGGGGGDPGEHQNCYVKKKSCPPNTLAANYFSGGGGLFFKFLRMFTIEQNRMLDEGRLGLRLRVGPIVAALSRTFLPLAAAG